MKKKDVVMVQITLFQAPDFPIVVGHGSAIRYEAWLEAEQKRLRKLGRIAEIRRQNKEKALFVDKIA